MPETKNKKQLLETYTKINEKTLENVIRYNEGSAFFIPDKDVIITLYEQGWGELMFLETRIELLGGG